MKPLETKKEYSDYVDKKSPNSPILKNCFNAFWVGGLICSIGQLIMDFCMYKGMEQTQASTVVSIVLIAISAILTGLNIFNKIGKFAGNGSRRKNVHSSRACFSIWYFYLCYYWHYCNSIFRLKVIISITNFKIEADLKKQESLF